MGFWDFCRKIGKGIGTAIEGVGKTNGKCQVNGAALRNFGVFLGGLPSTGGDD